MDRKFVALICGIDSAYTNFVFVTHKDVITLALIATCFSAYTNFVFITHNDAIHFFVSHTLNLDYKELNIEKFQLPIFKGQFFFTD